MLAKSSPWGHPAESRKSFCSSSCGKLRFKKSFPSVAKEPSKNHFIQPYCHELGHLPLDQLLTSCESPNLLPKSCSFAPRLAYCFFRRRFLLLRHPQAPQDTLQGKGTDLAVQHQNLLLAGTELPVNSALFQILVNIADFFSRFLFMGSN